MKMKKLENTTEIIEISDKKFKNVLDIYLHNIKDEQTFKKYETLYALMKSDFDINKIDQTSSVESVAMKIIQFA